MPQELAEEGKSSSARILGNVFGMLNAGVLLLDAVGYPLSATPAAWRLLGCMSERDLKDQWKELLPSLPWAKSGCEAGVFAALLNSEHGRREIGFDVRPLKSFDGDSQSRHFYVLIWNVHAAENLETDLLLASRMKTQITLHGALVHDLRTPLNAMQLVIELLDSEFEKSCSENHRVLSKQQKYITALREEVARLDLGLQSILQNSKASSTVPQIFDLADLLKEIGALLKPKARHQFVEMVFGVPEGRISLFGLKDRLKQVFIDLAIQELESMKSGGRLIAEMKTEEGYVSVCFRDEAIDISRGSHFEPLENQVNNGSSSTLHVVERIVRTHGGQVFVLNSLRDRALYRVMLPVQTR